MFRFFEGLIDPYMDYPKADAPPRRLWPFLKEYMRPFRGVFAVTALLGFAVAVGDVMMIWYVGRIVDLLAQMSPAEVWSGYGTEIVTVGLLVLLVRPVATAIDVALLHSAIVPNFSTMIRWRAHRHVLRQPTGWFENDFAGRIANRIMQAPNAAGEVVFQVFDALAFATVTFAGAVLMLARADPRLAIPMLLWLLGYLLLIRWTLRRAGPAATAASDARSALTGRIVDSYTNIHAVKLFAHDRREIDYAKAAIELTRSTVKRQMRIIVTMDATLTMLNGALIVAVTGLAVTFWMQGAASVGTVASATALVLRLNNMTYWIMWVTTSLVQNLGIVEEGLRTITEPVGLVDAPAAPDLTLAAGRIEVQDVHHHYGRGSGGLRGVTLSVAPGEKIGLVGRSGAGKSTLVKLILRLTDPEGGRILIDGQDVTAVTQDSLRRQIGVVQQDSSLLHRSVRENILYGRPDATEAEMQEAARRAEAEDFVLTLKDPEGREGYDAQVGERGVKLSGGQRQRIGLARVILKDAPVLILDEATSALDSEVEATIQATLYGVMEGKTVIAIAHRLSTIARMDRIVVLDDGAVAEQGSHAELLARGGLYARFWARQSGGFIGLEAAAE